MVMSATPVFATAARDVSMNREFDCLVEARSTVEIRSPVEGLIELVHVARGDLVQKGQVLVTLESGPERAALALALERSAMRGALKASESRLDFAARKEERSAELFKQNFVSLGALDEARTQRELAEAELRESQENLRLAELEVVRADEQFKLRTIRSPFNGVVVDKFLSNGEFATANVKQPILKLAEVNPLHVEVVLPAALFGKVRRGHRGRVMPEAPGGQYDAVVSVVDRTIDGASGTFGVRLELPNPEQRIPAGAKCKVRFAF